MNDDCKLDKVFDKNEKMTGCNKFDDTKMLIIR